MEYAEILSAEIIDKPNLLNQNAESLSREINWFAQYVNSHLKNYFPKEITTEKIEPAEEKSAGWWSKIVHSKPSEPLLLPEKTQAAEILDTTPPDLTNDKSVYAEFAKYYKLSADERLVLILALIPHVQPQLLDVFLSINKNIGRGYTEFGGLKANRHSGFLPTVETALFLLAGNDLNRRFRLYSLFEPDHVFSAHNILQLDAAGNARIFLYCTTRH